MKVYIQIFACCILLFFAACASDTSTEAPVKESSQNTITKAPATAVNTGSATTNQVVPASNNTKSAVDAKVAAINSNDVPPPELTVGNYTGSTDMEKAKKGINGGTASKLGLQMGQRFCKCADEKLVNTCRTKLINSLEGLKKTLHPKIAEICEKAFLAGKKECE